jgi:HEAT repeat protein
MGLLGGGKKDSAELEQQRDVKGLLKLLGSSGKETFTARQNAALSLAKLQAPGAVPDLIKLAENRALDVAEHAYLALGLIGGDDALAYLVRRLDTPDPERLGHVIWALGNIADPRAFESVAPLTAHPTVGVRRNALRALAQTDVQRAVPYLVSALRDQDSDSRCQALEGLTKALGQDSLPYVVDALEDEHMFVQSAAIRQLGELGGEAAEPYLLHAANPDNRSPLLHPAEDALIAMGHPAGLDVVERLLGGFKVDRTDDPVFRGSTLLIQFMKQSPDNRARALAYGGRVGERAADLIRRGVVTE